MGEDRILDIMDKKRIKVKKIVCLISLLFCFFISSCAFPRIIIVDDPLSPEEHINLGLVYERKGEIEHAMREYELAAKKLPVAYLYIANIQLQKGIYDEAEENYRYVIRKLPDNADAYNNLAWLLYLRKESLEEAEELALKALRLKPDDENYKDTLNKIRELLYSKR